MTENTDIIDRLNELIELDTDAVLAYSQAIANVDNELVKDNLISFLADHDLHLAELSTRVINLGGTPPVRPAHTKGYVNEGFTPIKQGSDIEAILTAIRADERILCDTYTKALEDNLPAALADLIRQHVEEERRHMAYLERALTEKPWNRLRAVG